MYFLKHGVVTVVTFKSQGVRVREPNSDVEASTHLLVALAAIGMFLMPNS